LILWHWVAYCTKMLSFLEYRQTNSTQVKIWKFRDTEFRSAPSRIFVSTIFFNSDGINISRPVPWEHCMPFPPHCNVYAHLQFILIAY
jgi:hypothetical protein